MLSTTFHLSPAVCSECCLPEGGRKLDAQEASQPGPAGEQPTGCLLQLQFDNKFNAEFDKFDTKFVAKLDTKLAPKIGSKFFAKLNTKLNDKFGIKFGGKFVVKFDPLSRSERDSSAPAHTNLQAEFVVKVLARTSLPLTCSRPRR